jgi:hypothetical protein
MSSIILGEPIERMEVNEFLLEVTADDIPDKGGDVDSSFHRDPGEASWFKMDEDGCRIIGVCVPPLYVPASLYGV